MKKLLLSLSFIAVFGAFQANAQGGGGDPAVMMQRMKERLKPELIEKIKLTEAQADKVVEINFESRQQMRELRDLNQEDRKKKSEEIKEGINKKYKELPLTDDQIKAVNTYFEEMRKQNQQRQGGN